jgi:hypothetical protein
MTVSSRLHTRLILHGISVVASLIIILIFFLFLLLLVQLLYIGIAAPSELEPFARISRI